MNGTKIPSRSINFFPLFRRGEEVIHPSSTEQREATRFRWGRRRDTFKRNTAMTRYPSSRRRKSERKERNLRIGKREREIRVSNTRSDAPVKGRERGGGGENVSRPVLQNDETEQLWFAKFPTTKLEILLLRKFATHGSHHRVDGIINRNIWLVCATNRRFR